MTLSLMWQMKREAERDFNKFIKYVAGLEKENKELKEKSRYYKTKSEFLNKVIVKYQDENKELKEELEALKADNQWFRARLDMLWEKE